MRAIGNLRVVAMLTGVSLAAAQPPPIERETGSLIGKPAAARYPDQGRSDVERARTIVFAYAACVAGRSRRSVEAALPRSDGRSGLSDLASSDCLMNADIRMSQPIFRGALFAALYRADYFKIVPTLPEKPFDFRAVFAGKTFVPGEAWFKYREFASCVIHADPASSRALVLSAVASAQETLAFKALMPHLNDCIDPSSSVRFGKADLIGLIAEVLYRETRAAGLSGVAR